MEARNSYTRMLGPIHPHGPRMTLGTFRTTPAQSLFVEANEPPLHLKRLKLALQYAVNIEANLSNSAFPPIFLKPGIPILC